MRSFCSIAISVGVLIFCLGTWVAVFSALGGVIPEGWLP